MKGKYPGVLASLLLMDKLSIEDIKASVTELMAGGVDTVTVFYAPSQTPGMHSVLDTGSRHYIPLGEGG